MGKLDTFMQELSRELKLENPLTPSMPGVYFLPLEENLSITINESLSSISFTSTIAPTPKVHKEAFFQEMLEGNLFGQGTQGGFLSLTEDGKNIILTTKLSLESNYDVFAGALEDFIVTVDFWRDEALQHK